MSLFQSTVVKKYANTFNKLILDEKWQLFTTIFHNTTKQDNIRNSKEEQYQAIFLNDLFVQVLGYTQHPNTDYNLITEQKNETNSKKADGAIIINNNVHAVIELKGTETTDLSKIETQAFGYKNNQKECTYVIISNFEKLRFYIDNATECVEFNLFKLNREEFNLLFICLSLTSIESDLPKKIKNESVSNEDKITKDLYKDYSAFRKELFADMEQINPQYDRLLLFKKTQKLLDRFLFIFFAEDRQLLPTNLIFSINLEWQKLREARVPVSLYDRYKMYFQDLNTGARVSLPAFGKHTNEIVTAQYDIYAYNGGLFQPDDILDTIAINDDLLFKHTKKLSEYDFESEVDVNILGHIFENSLNEIDEITNAIEGQEVDKTKTKRKKDGVFYTPKYITKYIVDNTIGKLCEEKKTELALDETKYTTDKRITVATKKKLIETLDHYRKWLLQLTIVDPACGSGAFLNQALEFLIAEHKYVDELQAKLFGDALVLSDVEGSILENNLFGVDLNEESVEIAKLSLWLRTAQRNRKLNSLNNNIKCGNSLIEDATIAGDKAFHWHNEFPQVFAKGGFDVVIGNPPYVRNTMLKNIDKDYLNAKYESAHQQYDLYVLFTELGLKILKQKSFLSYIIPNKFIATNYGLKNRKYILENSLINEIKDISNENIFIDASVYPVIINLKKKEFKKIDDKTYDITSFKSKTNNNYSFIEKLNLDSLSLINICSITETIHTGNVREKLIIDKKLNSKCKPLLRGRDLDRYSINPDLNLFVNFDNDLILKENGEYANLTNPKLYENEKILIRDISLRLQAYYDDEKYYSVNTLYSLIINNKSIKYKYLLSILNSDLISFWFKSKFNDAHVSGGYLRFKKKYVSQIPIKISNDQQPFIEKADVMLSLNKSLQEVSLKFSKYFSCQFKLEKLSGKLEKWYEVTFEEFIKEINKAIKAQKGTPLSKKDEFDWIDLFEENKQKANALQQEIAVTDKAIDTMVYELYGLTPAEIAIVEGS